MNSPHGVANPPLLLEPTYGYAGADGTPYRPTLREVVHEWLDAMNGWRYPQRRLVAASFLFHLATAGVGMVSMFHVTWDGVTYGLVCGTAMSFVYHTLWYHRYCSHAAFSFSSRWWARALLWTNPLAFREEMYALPHRVHHERSDRPGDPYGPHLGWLGSYLATESQQKINTVIDERRYRALTRGLAHIGIPLNSHRDFQRSGSVEPTWHFLTRTVAAQALWIAGSFALGGWHYVSVYYMTVFVLMFFMREFPWRGHGGNFREHKIEGWEFDQRSRSLNMSIFGYLGGEWHDNHHLLPASANCAFLPGQVDLPFQILRLWRRLGIVRAYCDASDTFRRRRAGSGSGSVPAADAPKHDAPQAVTAEDLFLRDAGSRS